MRLVEVGLLQSLSRSVEFVVDCSEDRRVEVMSQVAVIDEAKVLQIVVEILDFVFIWVCLPRQTLYFYFYVLALSPRTGIFGFRIMASI